MWGISCLAENRLASQEELCCMEYGVSMVSNSVYEITEHTDG